MHGVAALLAPVLAGAAVGLGQIPPARTGVDRVDIVDIADSIDIIDISRDTHLSATGLPLLLVLV